MEVLPSGCSLYLSLHVLFLLFCIVFSFFLSLSDQS